MDMIFCDQIEFNVSHPERAHAGVASSRGKEAVNLAQCAGIELIDYDSMRVEYVVQTDDFNVKLRSKAWRERIHQGAGAG